MSKKLLCISNDTNFLLLCKLIFRYDFDLFYSSYDQIDLYYEVLPSCTGVLVSDKDVLPKQRKKASIFFQRAPVDSVFVCSEKADELEDSTQYNVILIDENFKKNILLRLGANSAKNPLPLIGNAKALAKQSNYSSKTFKEWLDIASKCDSIVLLIGETGSGKNFAARYIHNNSSRNKNPFTEENLANINPSLMESTLFGTTRGSFTTAEDKIGLLETAKDGTLFLDEIGDLSLENQGNFLRFLDTMIFRRMGSQSEIKCNARIIFATSVDLIERIKAGLFREELFYRISVLIIKIPPLRERKDEIESIALKFAALFDKKLSAEAVKKLETYSWPGNIRELKACIERSSVQASNEILSDSDIIFLKDCF